MNAVVMFLQHKEADTDKCIVYCKCDDNRLDQSEIKVITKYDS